MFTSLAHNESSYAKRRQERLALVNELRAIGAQADLDLPRIAAIGNQSAGKSSLVEAISGINVPRDAGTCTRCPIECRMTNSSTEWSCQVLIRWEFNEDGSRRLETTEAPFGPCLTDNEDVELMLRRAQAAVLNHDTSMEKFIAMSAEELKHLPTGSQLQFSSNTICVDISGLDLTDLTFVDLPGIIQNAEPEIVMLVERLIRLHIRGNCIILVTLPMSDDIENQMALRLAKEIDPRGIRTLGVLTKPDTIPSGASKSKALWLDVVEGRRFPLKLGYFCARQPDEDERITGITHSMARAAEERFFAETAPWSTSSHSHRFGTQNLVETLSTHLSNAIDDSLPDLLTETGRQLDICNDALTALPPPVTSEPLAFVLNMIVAFCNHVKTNVEGNFESASLVQGARKSYTQLKINVRRTAPLFVPDNNLAQSSTIARELLKLDDNDNELGDIDEVERRITPVEVRERINQAITRELPNNIPYSAKLSYISDFQIKWHTISQQAVKTVSKSLNDTVETLAITHFGKYTRLLTDIKSALVVLQRLKLEETTKQVSRLLKYESTAYTQNDHYLMDAKQKILDQYRRIRSDSRNPQCAAISVPDRQTSLPASSYRYDAPTTIGISDCLRTVTDEYNGTVNYVSVSALPSHNRWSHEELRVSDYQIALRLSNAANSTQTLPSTTHTISPFWKRTPSVLHDKQDVEDQLLQCLRKLGFRDVTTADLAKLRPMDEYEKELELMAEIRAYFKVAYKRVIDNIPLAIDHELLYAFAEELQSHLIQSLGLGSKDAASRCAAYLAEDPKVTERRDELTSKKKRLLAIQSELLNAGSQLHSS